MLEGVEIYNVEVMQRHFLYLCTNLETFNATTSVARRKGLVAKEC
jgi:hypothetical protein